MVMKIPEHLALSYLLAQLGPQQTYGPAGTALVMVAGMLPDLDGVSILGGWNCHLKYHRKVGHGLPMTLFGPLLLALAWSPHLEGNAWLGLWMWLQLSLVLHLLVDLLFYRWRVQLLWPLSDRGVGIGLVGWNDLVPTLILYTATATALVWPITAPWAAVAALGLLGLYLLWRAWRREPLATGWLAWLSRDWTHGSSRVWRWLTGDFIT
jgi:membrane-bound metal-dependent hydrolase YbcI (DUF457 family)